VDYEEARKQVQQISNNVNQNRAPKNGLYLFEVISGKLAKNTAKADLDGDGEGCKQLQLRIAPVGANDKPVLKFATTEWVTLPLQNPEIADHTVSEGTLRKFTQRFAFWVDDSIKLPESKKDSNGKFVPWTGDELLQMEDAKVKALMLAYKLKDAPDVLKKERFFAQAVEATKPEKKGEYYLQYKRIALAAGETVTDLSGQ
jgi:hypothetical protein